jgi:hypothetical protein
VVSRISADLQSDMTTLLNHAFSEAEQDEFSRLINLLCDKTGAPQGQGL